MANRTTNQRLTKAERKEQARQQRLELQRKMARTRRNRRIAIAVVLVLAAGSAAYALTRPEPERATPGELLAAAQQARQTAGCASVQDVGPFQPKNQDRAHIVAAIDLSQYPSIPPTSGPHNEIPYGAGVFTTPPPMDRVIHSLEHGAAIVWYSPDAEGSPELERMLDFFDRGSVGARVIVAPYDYPDQGAAGALPGGAQMALVAWHKLQTCDRLSLPAAFGFTSSYAAPPFGDRTYKGEAPEPGGAF